MIAATARTIPKTYASLADAGFVAMYPSWATVPGTRPGNARLAATMV
jgi:hypothetical protein